MPVNSSSVESRARAASGARKILLRKVGFKRSSPSPNDQQALLQPHVVRFGMQPKWLKFGFEDRVHGWQGIPDDDLDDFVLVGPRRRSRSSSTVSPVWLRQCVGRSVRLRRRARALGNQEAKRCTPKHNGDAVASQRNVLGALLNPVWAVTQPFR